MSASGKQIKAILAIIGANAIYGINYVIAKGIMPDYLAPRAIIMFRVVLATIIFWLITYLLGIRQKVEPKDFKRLALCALFGVATNQILFFEGLNLTTPINAGIIMTTVPVLVLIFAHYILHEKITTNKVAGIILAGTGAALVILSGGRFDFSSGTFAGNLMVFLNASSFAFYLILIKPLMSKYHPLVIIKWIFLIGTVIVIPICIGPFLESDFQALPLRIWASLAYIVVFTTAIAYYLNNYSMKVVSPTVTGTFIYLQPILASVVAISLGMDRLTWVEVVASILIFTGVYFVSRRSTLKVRVEE